MDHLKYCEQVWTILHTFILVAQLTRRVTLQAECVPQSVVVRLVSFGEIKMCICILFHFIMSLNNHLDPFTGPFLPGPFLTGPLLPYPSNTGQPGPCSSGDDRAQIKWTAWSVNTHHLYYTTFFIKWQHK